MKLSVVDVCPCAGALASAGSAYFVDVDPSSDRVAEVKERLARHPFLRANMGAAAAGRNMASAENQHLFCKAGGGGEVVEMEESKVLSYYGFGSAGGPADMAVVFGEVDQGKTDKVRSHFGSADPDKQWLSLVVSHGGNRQHLVMKPGHPVFMFQTGVFNHTQIPMERQCLELEGRCLVIRDPMEKLGNFGFKNGSVVVVTDKGPGPAAAAGGTFHHARGGKPFF